MEANPHALSELSRFCKFCILFLQELPEKAKQTRTLRAQDQSFETFRESAYQRCFICSTLWNLNEKYRIAWSNFQPAHWTPMLYIVRRDEQETFLRLNVIYHDPVRGGTSDIRFRIISTEGIYSTYQITCVSHKLICFRQTIRATVFVQGNTTKHIVT
jgi:hypothetical protein